MGENFVEMELREIYITEDSHTQVIVLGEKSGDRTFQIYIGLNEALAMDLAVRGKRTARPMTHDLILNVMDGLSAELVRVLVVKLQDDTFYGALEVRSSSGELVRIDSRPSDAIVLAMKRQVPIGVEDKVLRDVQRSHKEAESEGEESEEEEGGEEEEF